MKLSTSLLAFLAIGSAAATFFLLQIGGHKQHPIDVGMKGATACPDNAKNSPCLPPLTYLDTDGQSWTPDLMSDNVVIVNFWATWCKPCLKEIPILSQVYADYKHKGVILLGILTEDVGTKELQDFTRRTNINFPIIHADEQIFEAFGFPEALPTTFIYDRSGIRRIQHRGAVKRQQLTNLLDELTTDPRPLSHQKN